MGRFLGALAFGCVPTFIYVFTLASVRYGLWRTLLTIAFIIALAFNQYSLYTKGRHDGEWTYKRSIHMTYALKSAYHFGYMDAAAGQPEDWDGEIQQRHHSEVLDKRVLIGDVIR